MPTTSKKYRVQDIAKDMGVDRAEIIEVLEKTFGGAAKKAQTALSPEQKSLRLRKRSLLPRKRPLRLRKLPLRRAQSLLR